MGCERDDQTQLFNTLVKTPSLGIHIGTSVPIYS